MSEDRDIGADGAAARLSLPHLHRPPVAPPEAGPAPLLVLFHGVGANERDLAPIAEDLDPRLRVVIVRSPIELGPDQYGWFHVEFGPDGPVIDPDEAATAWRRATEVVREAARAYRAEGGRTYVGGFSQGGIMALAALLTAPADVAGAAVLSGRLLPHTAAEAAPRADLAGRPALWIHGLYDPVLPVADARAGRDELVARHGLDLTYRELEMGHEVPPEARDLLNAWLTARLDEGSR